MMSSICRSVTGPPTSWASSSIVCSIGRRRRRRRARARARIVISRGWFGNKGVHEGAVQRLGDPPKRSQLDASFLFGSLKVNDARLADAQPLGELRRAHPKGLADGLYPAPAGWTVPFSWSELRQSLVETGTGLSRDARDFHRPDPIDKCI